MKLKILIIFFLVNILSSQQIEYIFERDTLFSFKKENINDFRTLIDKFNIEMNTLNKNDVSYSNGNSNRPYTFVKYNRDFGLTKFFIDFILHDLEIEINLINDKLSQVIFRNTMNEAIINKINFDNSLNISRKRLRTKILGIFNLGKYPEKHHKNVQLLSQKTILEFGWICEYSTIGSEPYGRLAIFELLNNKRYDLISKLLRSPNPEGRLYSIEAMIYLKAKGIKISKADQKVIDYFFGKNIEYYICGNSGSYKIYKKTIKDILNSDHLSTIIKYFDSELKKLGT